VPHFLDRMDVKWTKLNHIDTTLSMKPSEYFERQVWVSVDPDEATLASTASMVGANKILWATDYPHADGELGVVDEVLEAVEDFTDDAQRQILGTNAAGLYGLVKP
jgi:predicted TIM-barrel fold metal-dependent hydrolase